MDRPEEKEAMKEAEVQELRSPGGKVLYAAILAEGNEELNRSASALFWSGLAAGMSMSFSLITQGLLQSHLPATNWRDLIVKFGYCVGFVCVVLGRQQLFTENTLTAVLPALKGRTMHVFGKMLRLWGIVLIANLLGALATGWVVVHPAAFDGPVRDAFVEVGHAAMLHGFWITLCRAVFAGWLIALMVWLLPFAETGRIGVIVLITYVIGLGGFGHVIAGSVDVFALAAAGEITWAKAFGSFVLPALIGNVIGGVTLVAAINHAQVVGGGDNLSVKDEKAE